MKSLKLLRFSFKWLMVLAVLVVLVTFCLNLWIRAASSSHIYTDPDKIPPNRVGLVLGTSRFTVSGGVNLHFKNRMDAAALLYKKGKIQHILASGDNLHKNYNEPEAMREELMIRGVPKDAITLDFAGLRTLDSIVRAKEVFGQDKFTIISQEYHTSRAVFIAQYHGIDAIAFCAQKVPAKHSIKTEIREYLAKVKAVMDLYILSKKPKFLGKKEPIDFQK